MNAKNPLLTIVMPTHDVGSWVRETLLSVLSQDIGDLEVIVVDDHSEDDTLDVVARIAAEDPRVKIVNAVARGGGSARNEGVARARGRFLIFCDGDDLVPDGAYSALVGSLRESGSDIAFGDYLKFRPGDTWRPTDSMPAFDEPARGVTLSERPSLLYSRPCWNKAFRTDWWVRNGLEFPDVPRSNDIVPMVRAYLTATKVDVIPEVVYLYRERPGTGSMTARADSAASVLSYLAQENVCAGLVMDVGDHDLAHVYANLIYDRDGYVHVARFLSRWPGPTDDDAAVTDAVATLLGRIPAASKNVSAAKRIPLQLVAVGEIAAARALVASGTASVEEGHALLEAWRDALTQIEDRALHGPGDGEAFVLPLASALTARGGSDAVEAWRSVAVRVRRLFGRRELMLVPEAGAPDALVGDLLRTRDAVDGVVTGVQGGRTELLMTGTACGGAEQVRPVLYDGEFEGNPPIEALSVTWRDLPGGRHEWSASFPVTALPLHRPLTPALVVATNGHAVSVRCDAQLPEYDPVSPLLLDPFDHVLLVRRRRHWAPRAARRALVIARDRARETARRVRRRARRG